jgi:mannose-1-phosphate guanylyltransferase
VVAFHVERHALGTLVTTSVDDPSRYGLLDVQPDGRVASFIEKPGDDWPGPGLINAGVYVLEHEVLDLIPAQRQVSAEREVFPPLAESGSLFAYVGTGYWRDIGTPQSYLHAHFDLLRDSFRFASAIGDGFGRRDAISVSPYAQVDPEARLIPPVHVSRGAVVKRGATVGPLTVLGRDARIGRGARVVESVLQDGVRIGRDALVERSVIVRHATVGRESQLRDVVIGEACDVGKGNILANGLSLFPQATLPDRSVRFRDAQVPLPALSAPTPPAESQASLAVPEPGALEAEAAA